MATVLQYRLWCETEEAWKYVWAADTDPVPDTCPTTPADTITESVTSVIKRVTESSPTTSKGYPRIEIEAPEGTRLDVISPNFCDATTWFGDSSRVTDEVYTDSGDLLTYNPATSRKYVDVTHGKITGEIDLRATYAPVVKVNDVTKTEDSPGANDNDYTINYATGDVTFNTALIGSDVVKVSYSFVQKSTWVIAPAADKIIRLTKVEVQFSQNVVLNDTITFEVQGFVEVFAPHLLDTADPPGPYSAGTKIPIGADVYQTLQDFINRGELAFPSIPKMGGSNWRAMADIVHIFQWEFANRAVTDLVEASGMQTCVFLNDDVECGGDVAIATFYGRVEDA